ncbi:MAG: hypothetical protein LBC86_10490 [Oscillospiraceae bacterium]|jgi:hypothetical protein|nr:hypothetical protein [Oscillospiraceae bacterium]
MNISKRDIKMLLILFGIVIFVLCYFLVYLSHSEENEFLYEDIEDAEFELSRLKTIQREVSGYREAIADSEAFILAAQAEFPADVHTADLIMYVVELEQNLGINTGGITFIQPVELMTVQGLLETESGSYSLTPRNAFRTGINVNCSLTYEQLKELVNYINNESEKASIHSISLSYNSSTGLLYGNMVINRSFLSSHGIEYIAAQIPEMAIGLPNPFGVIRLAPSPLPQPQLETDTDYESYEEEGQEP